MAKRKGAPFKINTSELAKECIYYDKDINIRDFYLILQQTKKRHEKNQNNSPL